LLLAIRAKSNGKISKGDTAQPPTLIFLGSGLVSQADVLGLSLVLTFRSLMRGSRPACEGDATGEKNDDSAND
jgi:hypothetical protein